ncbi:MAG: hypothetical protein M3Y67_07125, partial [Pseudomonadota bacterium]|nr:hypothetical protein [Pseudomonadota bacterium]
WRQRVGAWLSATIGDGAGATSFDEWQPSAERTLALAEARAAFRAALDDVETKRSGVCLDHIRAARSLHELWHLRAEVFSLVSCRRSQHEADRRLGILDRHFPSRTRRGVRNTAAAEGHESVPPF